ncbi:lipoate--protein ligase family protein [Waddlia chondrophila]|uniref:Putative lipoate-protein ligase A n=1 Tax=Waddlia chondrophila (strain ATCC VR-1470 / WSU 86-1044) TaxID=716544 RepID=D6YSS1_WADCW|nr:lipoate--protein ligase family protein [Waddlia chondrophila]ADI39116.1 putative lipoate-protein ligase A [Waddlia chondrophila WSU 86-1044]
MKPAIHFLRLNHCPIFKQLQLEEALLRVDKRNWCIINEGTPDAIVMGISGKPEEFINQKRFEKHPVPVIRRFSGGGCVYVDRDTFFVTLILNHTSSPAQPFPQQILCWTKELYQPLIGDPTFCVRENDYVIGEHKFGGNAQYIVKNRWLHHSSLLWDFCPDKMEHLNLPSKRPDYRSNRSHKEFLCTLKPRFSSKETFWEQLESSLSSKFHIDRVSLNEAEAALAAPHRKATEQLIDG